MLLLETAQTLTMSKSQNLKLIIKDIWTSHDKKKFSKTTKFFEELSKNDIWIGNSNKTLNELLQLLTKEETVDRLIDLLYEVMKSNTSGRI